MPELIAPILLIMGLFDRNKKKGEPEKVEEVAGNNGQEEVTAASAAETMEEMFKRLVGSHSGDDEVDYTSPTSEVYMKFTNKLGILVLNYDEDIDESDSDITDAGEKPFLSYRRC